jgi:hypothetical protein
MRFIYLLPTAWLCAAVLGCGHAPTLMAQTAIPGNPPACDASGPNRASCVIHLKVTDDPDPKKPTDCDIKLVDAAGATLDDLDLVSLGSSRGNFVYWRIINSPGYEFTDDGIAFVDNNRPRMYTQSKRLSATEFQWKRNKRPDRRVNGYVVNVIKPNTDPTKERECELDPWIRTR